MKYLILNTTDPAFNLAAEQYVFDRLATQESFLMLWQNRNAIIIGKHQNTLAEINEAFVREHGIKVVRRLSGGGAVYHDLGNLNYTLIAPDDGEGLDLGRFCRPVIRALRKLGVDAEINGRNDMTVGGQKFSGNAQYRKDGRVMHHGTILFDSDMSVLAGALQVDEEKIKAKGVKSVRSRVANIRSLLKQDMTLQEFRDHLARHLLGGDGVRYELTKADLDAVEAIRAARYGTWEWNYGASPRCDVQRSARIEGVGTLRAHMQLDRGRIADIAFTGDFFSTKEPEGLSALLRGRPLTRETLAEVDPAPYISGMTAEHLCQLLLEG